MPLSDREQRILEEIEKNLYDEDPRFARATRRVTPRYNGSRRARLGALLFVIGLGSVDRFLRNATNPRRSFGLRLDGYRDRFGAGIEFGLWSTRAARVGAMRRPN